MQNYSFKSFDEIANHVRGANSSERANVKQYIIDIHNEAMKAANEAGVEFYNEYGDRDLCGFAWVTAYVNGNSFAARVLRDSCDFEKSYSGGYQLWNPAKLGCQSISVLEVGASAYVNTFRKYIPDCKIYAGSRLD